MSDEQETPIPHNYDVAYGDSSVDLEEMVNAMMCDGWTPQGGVCVVVYQPRTYDSPGDYGYYQAMIRAKPTDAS